MKELFAKYRLDRKRVQKVHRDILCELFILWSNCPFVKYLDKSRGERIKKAFYEHFSEAMDYIRCGV